MKAQNSPKQLVEVLANFVATLLPDVVMLFVRTPKQNPGQEVSQAWHHLRFQQSSDAYHEGLYCSLAIHGSNRSDPKWSASPAISYNGRHGKGISAGRFEILSPDRPERVDYIEKLTSVLMLIA